MKSTINYLFFVRGSLVSTSSGKKLMKDQDYLIRKGNKSTYRLQIWSPSMLRGITVKAIINQIELG